MASLHDDSSCAPTRPLMAPVPGWRSCLVGLGPALVLAVGLQGCALFPLAALGGAALSAGGSAITKGTEYTAGGTAHRTFTSPIDDIHRAILATFERTGIRLERDEPSGTGRRIVGKAEHRTVKVSLTSLTPTLTSLQLVVKRNILLKDRATASELIAQTERALVDQSALARQVGDDAERSGNQSHASTPRAARERR